MNVTGVSRQRLASWLARCYSYKSIRRPDISITRKPTSSLHREGELVRQNIQGNLTKHLQAKILATGPITVAEYMREVLTHPSAGYYMQRDVFGREGDFITSPEISQIFGELVGIWLLSEWRKLGSPSPFQLIELGPGRGTLTRDVLKVLTKFKLAGYFSIHLVEISEHLSKMQAQLFCLHNKQHTDDALPYYQSGETATGVKVYWYKRLEDTPYEFSLVLAHEFFDALPVHKLQRDGDVWKEILVDVAEGDAADFRFVLSKAQTPISRIYRPAVGDMRESLEYSVECDRIVSLLAHRLERDGGIGLFMDYGHCSDKSDTFRAFKKHQLHDPLKTPGSADLTADVDFRQMQRMAEANGQVICFGPVEQGVFLDKMGGETRLQQLVENALPENRERIRSGYEMLTDPQQMGARFKFFAMFPAILQEHLRKYPVNGFN